MITRPLTTSGSHHARMHLVALLLAALIFHAARPSIGAAQATPGASPAPPTAAGPADELGRGVPRTAVQGYLDACNQGDYARASTYLDLSHVPPARRPSLSPTLARELCVVLDRTLSINTELLSDAPGGDPDDDLRPRDDSVGAIQTSKGTVQILVERVPREDGTPIWKFAAATVAQIPKLYDEFGYGVLGELLPAPFFEVRVLQVQLWQWIGLLILVAVAAIGSWLITNLLVRLARPLLAHTRPDVTGPLLAAVVGPLRLTIGTLLFLSGSAALPLSMRANLFVGAVGKVLTVVAVTWLLLRCVDALSRAIEDRLFARRHVALSFVPLGRRGVKVLVAAMAVVVGLENLGFNVNSLLAGLGIGGLAIALAAQKTVENLFGSIILVTDQPVRVGDVCRFGDKVGTVEDIGLRSTRLRTPDRSIVSVANAEFATMQLENLSQRDRLRLTTTIGLRYETSPDQLRYILVEIRRMLLAHPKVHSAPARARFVNFGSSSLDLEIFAYISTRSDDEFLAIREDIFLRIMEIVRASGSGFALPVQIGYGGGEAALDAAKSRAAEAQVEKWRAENALYLPDVPAQQISALKDTLDYPPKGSATRAAT